MTYNHKEIESKWQHYWESNQIYKTITDSKKPKYYVLDMFPYPSGQGLHVGHPKGYVGSDVVARYKRMSGNNVLHPMGWDAFGLPTERQATKEGIHPSDVTKRNVDTFRQQLKQLSLSYDWDREINTSDPNYYRWTQWIFLKLFELGLAYQAEVPVNWCPALGTVLANEEVQDGKYVETGDPVERRFMRQWMLRITAYADRLLDDLDLLDWTESLKEMQRNWIGRSKGALAHFQVADSSLSFDIFTTRPDTLFGCTFCVLAPEHILVNQIVTEEHRHTVAEYVERAIQQMERERVAQAAPQTGVFTGAYAICPVNGKRVPIWVADYVLAYGTGAIFGCPAHDERDHAFAKRFNLPIIEVVRGGNVEQEAYTGDGPHVNSDFLNGMDTAAANTHIIDWLEEKGYGSTKINYKLRDWLFSRQRYWGEPIPVIHCQNCGVVPAPESELPVILPSLEEYTPTGSMEPPLAKVEEWVNTNCPRCAGPAKRETNTMPQWAGSCWYYLRFTDPHNDDAAWSKEAEKYWMPVDLYVGGGEHATLHLLYARFWHKVLYDLGYVSTQEPFKRLFNQGMVHARSFRDFRGKYYYLNEVVEKDGQWFTRFSGELLETKIEKMSKSRCNTVSPDEIIEEYGSDSLRLYELFLGPLENEVEWQTQNILGVRRFLERVWKLFFPKEQPISGTSEEDKFDESLEVVLHKTIKKVTEDIETLQLNTAISQLMIFVNEATKDTYVPTSALSIFARLLAPFAPHIAEELWHSLGNQDSVTYAPWPKYNPDKVVAKKTNITIQVNGKLRGVITVPFSTTEDRVRETALENPGIAHYLKWRSIGKVIFVPDKLLNFVLTNIDV